MKQNGKKLKERIHHPFLDLMKSVNIYGQTFRDIYLTVVHLDLFGNAYGYIVRNRLNMPEEILLLNPEHESEWNSAGTTQRSFTKLQMTGKRNNIYIR